MQTAMQQHQPETRSHLTRAITFRFIYVDHPPNQQATHFIASIHTPVIAVNHHSTYSVHRYESILISDIFRRKKLLV